MSKLTKLTGALTLFTIIGLSACASKLSNSHDIVYIPDSSNSVSAYKKVSDVKVSGLADKATTDSVRKYIEADRPFLAQGLCVSFHVTNGSTGAEACGLHCDNGNTYGMACDADIFDHWGFDKEYTE